MINILIIESWQKIEKKNEPKHPQQIEKNPQPPWQQQNAQQKQRRIKRTITADHFNVDTKSSVSWATVESKRDYF